MNRPYIICHMLISIDGKVTGDFLFKPECEQSTEVYYQINRDYKADAFACGRVTMEGSFTGGFYPDLTPFEGIKISREDYVADTSASLYAVAFDRNGRLGWKAPRIEDEDPGYGNSHIIEVLCENTSDKYLAYLQSIGISYIFAGNTEMDIPLALEKLKKLFGINKLLLEGGSIINGAFAECDLIDELSLVLVPMVAGTDGKPLFFTSPIINYELKEVKQVENSTLWLNYKKID